ncbi:conserved hypothetical protein [Desulfitobacterium hafniense DCB-2]|uniref:REase associating with pPIWI RE domain-containing protein n=2 Tax=Desulfitobacterium hafniense TaxID=49338 RepID=A0A098AX47_DESHA|nr:hypothetical protein [Desulfitobacterium hafniense]ACL18710.1 conserved hypothetical protein [Desulfitobacterium hafniense DCB-2]CDX00680.1 Hypothetical protein DPCES_0793 [Desulfitobacterium hafniense]
MDLAQKSLLNIIQGLRGWSRDWKRIPKEMYLGHLQFSQVALNEGIIPPGNLYDLLAMLQKPCQEWGIPAFEASFDLDASILKKYGGLSYEAEEFLEEHVSVEESEARVMLEILSHCREKVKEANNYQELYSKIREFISSPEHAVLPSGEVYDFAHSLQDKKLSDLFFSLYEPSPLPYEEYYYCPYCGWTLTTQRGKNRCTNRSCHLNGEFRNPVKMPNASRDVLWRLTPGIQRYVLVPGIAELKLYKRLETKKYDVQLYPEIDRYDIRVKLENSIVDIDVKEYYSIRSLADHINANWQKYHENSYIVIPGHVLREKPYFIERVANYLSPEAYRHINIIPESKVLSVLERGVDGQ